MLRQRIHLIAPAGACKPFIEALGFQTSAQLLSTVQEFFGDRYLLTANHTILEAAEDEQHGGRCDDDARVDDITSALAEPEVVAIVALRGGAWLTRLTPRIDFTVLDRRTKPVALFGFSELTPLVNIVAGYRQGRGIYDMGPAFLSYGLRRQAARQGHPDPVAWAREQLRPQLEGYLRDVRGMIEGRGSSRQLMVRLVRGSLPGPREPARFVGGNLTVLSTLVGTPWDNFVRPRGRWLMLEDFNDKLERIDRFLSHLTLADYWRDCAGLLLGDFHQAESDQRSAVLELLPHHLPRAWDNPVLVSDVVGHTWPMSPLPINLPLRWEERGENSLLLAVEPADLHAAPPG